MSWRDRTIGVLLGLVIGITAVILFVVYGSGETIDAPSLEGSPGPGAVEREAPARPGQGGE